MKRLSYISNELVYLKDYLTMSDRDKAIELATQNPYMFTSFLQQREDLFKEELGEDVYIELVEELDEDVTQHGEANYELINALPEYVLEEFYNWGRYADDPYAPSFLFMEYVDLVKNQWLIHFTNDAYSVATEGFTYGTPNYTHLGLTTYFTEGYKSGGYNFAYLLSDYLRHGFERHGPKYGKEAVIFRASGIQVYHYGDQEPQVIFDGASAQDIIPIYEADGTWFTGAEHPKTGNPLYQSDDIDKVVDWIVANFNQYKRLLIEGSLNLLGIENKQRYKVYSEIGAPYYENFSTLVDAIERAEEVNEDFGWDVKVLDVNTNNIVHDLDVALQEDDAIGEPWTWIQSEQLAQALEEIGYTVSMDKSRSTISVYLNVYTYEDEDEEEVDDEWSIRLSDHEPGLDHRGRRRQYDFEIGPYQDADAPSWEPIFEALSTKLKNKR